METSVHKKRQRVATGIATRAHHGQVRKSSGLPYVSHPIGVANMAEEFDYGRTVVIAALLHDVYEDSPEEARPSFEAEIRHRFPAAHRLVMLVTHDVSHDYVDYVLGLPRDALQLKLTDMLHNLEDRPSPRQAQKYAKTIKALELKYGGNPVGINARHWQRLLATIDEIPDSMTEGSLNLLHGAGTMKITCGADVINF